MTLEEWAAMPEDDEGELVDGVLVEEEMPDLTHETVVAWLISTLRNWLIPRHGFVFGSEAKFGVAPRRGRKADLTVYLPGCPPLPRRGLVRVPPDVAIEVVSPTARDRRRDRSEKAGDYAAFGVRWYWLVDPERRTLDILALGSGVYEPVVAASAGVVGDVPGCEGLALPLDELWAEIRPPSRRRGAVTPRVGLLCAAVAAALLACGGSSGGYRVERDVGADIQALGSDDLDVSDPAADRLAAFGPDAVPALTAALRREPPAVRAGAVEVLDRIDHPDAYAALVGVAARDPDADVRGAAISALAGGTATDEARSVVERALDDPAPGIRRAAAGACPALCESPAALERLVTLAIEDQPLPNGIAARAAVIQILGSDDPTRAGHVRAAIRARAPSALHAGDARTTLRAALLASDVGDPSGRGRLESAVRGDAPPLLRLQATYALGLVGDGGAVTLLAALDGQPGFGEYGYDALRRLAARDVGGAQAALDRWRGSRPAGELPPPPGAR